MVIVLVGALIRLLISYIFTYVVNHDTIGWATVGAWTLQAKNIYPYPAYEYHSFFPAFLYIDAFALLVNRLGIPFMLVIKVICSLFDAGNIYLMYLLSKKNKKIAWLYALNPISILVVAVHGQFESIPLFFLLLGVYLFGRKKTAWSGIAISFAVAFKTWPLLFAIPLLKRVWKWWYLALIGIIPLTAMLLYSLVFHAKIIDIIHYSLFYRGQTGNFGTGLFFRFLLGDPMSLRIFSNAFLLLFAWFSFSNQGKDPVQEIFDQMLFFYILSPTMGLQWLLWIMPFLLLEMPRWYALFIATTTLYVGSINLFWILQEKSMSVVKYAPQLGLLSWMSLVLIVFYRVGIRLKPYMVISPDNFQADKESKKQDSSGK